MLSTKKIGAVAAKRHLSHLLRRVEAGERFLITRYDRPVAKLIPATGRNPESVRAAIEHSKAFQRTHTLGTSVVELIREGRE